MPVVRSEDVIPKYTGDEIINKLATAVKALREMDYSEKSNSQLMELELMYSLAIYLRDKK